MKLPFLERLFCLLIVWGSGTLVTVNYSLINYAIVLTFALLIITGWIRYRNNMSSPIMVVLFFTALSIYLNYLYMGGRGVIPTVNNYLIIVCAILFAINKPHLNEMRIEQVIKVFLFFSFLSSALYALFIIGVLPVQSVSDEGGHMTFLYLLNVAPSDLVDAVYRNGCIYWEPGMYQVFLNFVLIYYLFNTHLKHRNFIIVYLVIVIITTISVSGYVLTLLIFGVYAFINNNRNRFLRYAMMFVIIVGIVYIIPTITGLLMAKQETGSFEKRNLDLVLAWEVFLEKPLLGYGIVNDAYDKAYLDLVGKVRPSSNGLMNLLMGTGVVGAIVYLFCYIRTLKFFSRKYATRFWIPLLLWLVVSINTEPMQFQPFICFLFGVGIAYTTTRQATNGVVNSI